MDGEPTQMWSQVRSYFIPEITDEYQILVIQSTRQGKIPVAHFSPKNTEKLIVRPTLRSFCIDDILSHKTAALQRGGPPSLPGIVMFSIVISIARYHNIFHQYCHKYCPPSMQGIVPQFVVFFISIVFCTKCSGYHLCYQLGNFTSWEGHFSISNAPPPP